MVGSSKVSEGIREAILLVGDFAIADEDIDNAADWLEQLTNGPVILANFELSPINVDPQKKAISLFASPLVIDTLSKYSGLHFSLVNNHVCDGSRDKDVLMRAISKIRVIHSFENLSDIIKFKGHSLSFWGDIYEDVSLPFKFNKFNYESIRSADLAGIHCIVHGGLEYRTYPTVRQRKLAELMIERGAESVIFHHSHCEGVHTTYKGKVIHYGLGNFMFSKVAGLHGFEHSSCAAVLISENGDVTGGRIYCESFSATKGGFLNADKGQYRKFYSESYPMDSSFRPRQLSDSFFINDLIYTMWRSVARPLVVLGISKKIKNVLNYVVR